MTTGLLLCHGKLANELIQTTAKIIGKPEHLYGYSNDGLSPEGLYTQIVDQHNLDALQPVVLLVDLHGGSCWQVAKMISRIVEDCHIVTGVNLPMIISFLTKRDNLTFDELIKMLDSDAKRGIVVED